MIVSHLSISPSDLDRARRCWLVMSDEALLPAAALVVVVVVVESICLAIPYSRLNESPPGAAAAYVTCLQRWPGLPRFAVVVVAELVPLGVSRNVRA
jgi:hypothetical protein